MIIGGTPTLKGLSAIDAEYELSDKRVAMVPCHDCGQEHELSFDHLHCPEDPTQYHEVYGHKRPELAYYACPHCGSVWDDAQKNANLQHGRWVATAEFRGIAGYDMNELIATFYGSRFAVLMEKWLQAEHAAAQGNIGPMIAFVNSSKGESYEFKSNAPGIEELVKRAEAYGEWTAPAGVLLATAGVDVQGDRLAVIVVGWGRGRSPGACSGASCAAIRPTPAMGSGLNWMRCWQSRSRWRAAASWLYRRRASTALTGTPTTPSTHTSGAASASTSWRSRGLPR